MVPRNAMAYSEMHHDNSELFPVPVPLKHLSPPSTNSAGVNHHGKFSWFSPPLHASRLISCGVRALHIPFLVGDHSVRTNRSFLFSYFVPGAKDKRRVQMEISQ